ncbi:tetratricopeptide repeat protein [Iodidimonas sp. SYSU 1G8]|uniref:tetratricopeptide repeat protein n=1 Tax=Iodidimonas sp. SYSU 1G8 TaxID=3133967 RepID=UPI0031FEA547
MSDIFREVDEEVRQEQIVTFLKRYGKYVAAVILLAIVIVVGYRYWEDRQRHEHAATGDEFGAAMTLAAEGKTAEALAGLKTLAAEAPDDSYGLLARFRQAELEVEAADTKAAQATYDAIAADTGVEKVYRDLAAYYGALLMLDAGGGAELDKRLDGMSGTDNVWRLSVMELKGLNQYKTGQRDAAVATFRELLAAAPDDASFKVRAQQMLAVLGVPQSEFATK